ncbi:hypothetical protein TNCV_3399601 [Trichonephila clavipes]|nr:hypothetical protein TNCV_3399601 [Trichonephila clavipes]
MYLQVDDHVHPNTLQQFQSEKNKTFFMWSFTITCRGWAMNEQMSYFSSFSDEWSRDLKTTKDPVVFKYRNSIHVEGNANQSATQNNGQTSRVKSLDEIVKMVRLLTVKVPNKSDGWDYFFSSLERLFASEMVSDELKPKVLLCMKNFDKGQVTEIKKFACFTCGSDKHFKRDCPKNKEVDNKRLDVNKVSTEGTELVDGTVAARVDLLEKPQEHIEDSQRNITSCRNEVGTLGTKDEEMTAEMDKGIMVADSFRFEQECLCRVSIGLEVC